MLTLQALDELIRHLETGIPVGVFTCLHHTLLRYLKGALFTGNTGEIDFILHMMNIILG